jgi:hypothetical protein
LQFCDVAKRWWSSMRQFSKNLCTNYTWKERIEQSLHILWLPTLIIYWNLVNFLKYSLKLQQKISKNFGWWKSQIFLFLLLDIVNIFPKIWGPPSSHT